MFEDALRWPMMDGTYLGVIGCLRAALVGLLGGVMDFSTVDAFGMFLETGLTLVLVNVKGSGRAGALRDYRFKQIFSSDVYVWYSFGCI